MAKDAKGHGSEKRGGGGKAKVSVDPAKIGYRMWDTGPGNSEHNVQTGGAWNADHEAAFQLARDNPKAAPAPVHPAHERSYTVAQHYANEHYQRDEPGVGSGGKPQNFNFRIGGKNVKVRANNAADASIKAQSRYGK